MIKKGLTSSVDESLELELDAIVDLGETESTQNLIRNFFLAEKYRKGASKTAAEKVVHAAVIGAGVMGSGIAQWLSSRGVTVILRDVSRELLDRGLANIEKTYADAVKRGLMTEEKAKARARPHRGLGGSDGAARCAKLVIEAASEKIEIKKEIFRELSMQGRSENNRRHKYLGFADGRTGWRARVSPDRVIGLHFFNPLSRMKLVEVVIGEKTSEETHERVARIYVRQIGKLPVVVRDRPGFLVNRVLFPYLLDAAELFEAGMDAEQIDDALVAWGMPMGPLRLIDEIGVDITVDIAGNVGKSLRPSRSAPARPAWMRDGGMLGRKTGSGFYKYEGKTQTAERSTGEMA